MQKTKTFSRLIAVLMTFTLVCGLLTAPMFASSDSNNPNDTAHSFGIEKALISPAALTSFNLSEWQDALDSALAWIVDNMPNPSIIDDWEVLTLARANAGSEDWFAAYLTALETELDNLETWADFQRATLALTALGFDATNFNGRDLTESFRNYVPASQRPYHSQGVNADIFALLALDSGAYTGDRELFVNAILAAQAESGSWAWTGAWGAWPAADLTAMAIQALALYYENPSVAAAISAGFSWIVEEYISDAETFAQIIIAGTALGRCVEATVVGLMNFYDAETGGFISPWTGETDAMSTEQAARALVAYYRFVNGMNAFFDMSDANERTTNGGNNGNGRPPILPPPPPQGRVFLSIRNDHASPNQRVLYEGYFNLTANETAFSLLNRTNLNIVTRGTYVVSIGGLREFDYGPQSGWMFTLNGVFPQFAAASAQLSNGDRVEWLFTINLGEDVGGGTFQPPPPPPPRPPVNVTNEENEEDEDEEELTPPEANEEPEESPATENNAPQETETENEINETVPIVPITQWTNPFADVTPNDWFYPAVQFLYTRGIMSGTAQGQFSPNSNITRAMIVTMLWRLEGEPILTTSESLFADVAPTAWYSNAIAWAGANNIVSGIGGGLFAPSNNITREQFAVILYNYARFANADTSNSATAANLNIFDDAENISPWALEAMAWAIENGIITGRTATTLAPSGTATRAEAAAMLQRFIESKEG